MRSYIHDNVHGRIDLTPLERAIIETPTFVRLTHIAQLGLTSFVFPGATHTRSSHCVGTLAVMGQICRELDLTEDESTKLKLAALLHDCGQYPLSHVIETVYRLRGQPLAELVTNPTILDDVSGRPTLQRVAVRPIGDYARDKALASEIITRRLDLLQVFRSHGLNDDWVEDLSKIVQGKHTSTLYRHLLDSDYDCDRLDYIGRDAQMTGVPYGRIDLQYLIQNMSAVRYPPGGADRVLCLDKRKALHSLEHYLTSRYYLYSQVVFHKTVRALELLAKAVFFDLAERGDIFATFEDIRRGVETDDFLRFDDHCFWERVRVAASGNDSTAKWSQRLIRRDPLHYVMEFKGLLENDAPPPNYARAANWLLSPANLAVVVEDAELDIESVVAEELSIEFVPVGSEVPVAELIHHPQETQAAVRNTPYLLREDGGVEFLLTDDSTILRVLSTKKLKILRLYLDGDAPAGDRLRRAAEGRIV